MYSQRVEQAGPGETSGRGDYEGKRREDGVLNKTSTPKAGEADVISPRAGRKPLVGGLRGRLLLLTVGLVLVGLMLLYPLLAANYRNVWLNERAQAAQIAALAVEAAPDGRVSEELSRELLEQAQVVAVVAVGEDFRELVLAPSVPIGGPVERIDLREQSPLASVPAALGHLLAKPGRFLLLSLTPSMTADEEMEIIVPEAALRGDMLAFSRNFLLVSLFIAAAIAAGLYFAVYGLVVRPMRELTGAIVKFGESPEHASLEFSEGGSHEMRKAKDALVDMQQTVSTSFRQRKRLADLGEVVAKINHDLRNSLAAAQIVSEGLAQSDDPRVRKAAPRLERSIERAVGLAEATLSYGKEEPPGAVIQTMDVEPPIREAVEEAMTAWPMVAVEIEVERALQARVDPDHIHRIVVNLCRNAACAIIEADGERRDGRIRVSASNGGDAVRVEIADNGPGIPKRLVPKLFRPFEGSGSRAGSGLGLAISRELAQGMSGELHLLRSDESGAVFVLSIPGA